MATEPGTVVPVTQKIKYILTIANYITFLGNGLAASILPSARLDVAELVNSDFQDISYGQTCRAAGYIFGCLLLGWLFTIINRQLGLVSCLILTGIAILATPFSRSLWFYLVMESLYGTVASGLDIATNSWLMEIWCEEVNPFMQGMHFCFAVGMVVAPLITEPFLSYDQNVTHANGTKSTIHEASRITVPSAISSGYLFMSALMILVLYFKVPYTDPQRILGPKSVTGGHTVTNNNEIHLSGESDSTDLITTTARSRDEQVYYIQLVILGCLLIICYTGVENSTLNFLPQFAVVIPLSLSKSKAAFLSSVMSAAFAVSRLLAIGVATRIRTKTMLYGSFVMILLGNLMLLIWSTRSETMLWIAVVMIGAGQASVFPCIMSFLEERMNVTTIICSAFSMSAAVILIFVPIIFGSMIQDHPMIYVYVNLIGLTGCLVTFAVLYLIDRRFRRAQRQQQNEGIMFE